MDDDQMSASICLPGEIYQTETGLLDTLMNQHVVVSAKNDDSIDACDEHILTDLVDTVKASSSVSLSERQFGDVVDIVPLENKDYDFKTKLEATTGDIDKVAPANKSKEHITDKEDNHTLLDRPCAIPVDANQKRPKQKRVKLSDEQKRQICLHKVIYPKTTYENIAEHFSKLWSNPLKRGKVYQVLRSRDKWLAMSDISACSVISEQKLEETLYEWYLKARKGKTDSITDSVILKKAKDLKKQLHVTDMIISKVWLLSFKDKCDIRVTKNVGGKPIRSVRNKIKNGEDCYNKELSVNDNSSVPVTIEEARQGAMTVISYFNASGADTEDYLQVMWNVYKFLVDAEETKADESHTPSNVNIIKHETNWSGLVNTSLLNEEDAVGMDDSKELSDNAELDASRQHCQDYGNSHHVQVGDNTSSKLHACDQCEKSFSSMLHLLDHMVYHSRIDDEICKPIQKKKSKRPLKRVSVKENVAYTCSTCGKNFKKSTHLHRHEMAHTGERPFKCSLCDKGFCEYGNLRTHMRVHTGERPYLCTICGKRFAQTSILQAHMTVHTGEKKFKCNQCGRCFSQQCNLREHVIAMHTDARPFICPTCGKGFIRAKYLDLHMRNHTGEKPHTCQVCNKSFSQGGYLRRHMEVHTGEKPHQCPTCRQRFITNTVLKAHIRTHTGERPYCCKICGKTFSQGGTLHNHYKMHKK